MRELLLALMSPASGTKPRVCHFGRALGRYEVLSFNPSCTVFQQGSIVAKEVAKEVCQRNVQPIVLDMNISFLSSIHSYYTKCTRGWTLKSTASSPFIASSSESNV